MDGFKANAKMGFGSNYCWCDEPVKKAQGGSVKSKVNAAGNYTKPSMRKALFNKIKASSVQGTAAGQWSARKAQLLAKKYKEKGGGYRD